MIKVLVRKWITLLSLGIVSCAWTQNVRAKSSETMPDTFDFNFNFNERESDMMGKLQSASDTRFDRIWQQVGTGIDGGAAVVGPDIEWRRSRYPLSSLVPICSVTKLMTAQMIMQLIHEQKLELMTKARTLLSWMPEWTSSITVEELLTHTSGLANMNLSLGEDAAGNALIYLTRERRFQATRDRVLGLIGDKATTEAGKKFDYNNTDFIVLQAIVEQLDKSTYAQSLTKRILRPAKMSQTYLAPWGQLSDRVLKCMHSQDGRVIRGTDFNFGIYGGAGGAVSSLTDVIKWIRWSLEQPADVSPLVAGSKFGGFQGFGCYAYSSNLFGTALDLVERPGAIAYYQWQITVAPSRKVAVIAFSLNDGAKLGNAFEKGGPVIDLMQEALKP